MIKVIVNNGDGIVRRQDVKILDSSGNMITGITRFNIDYSCAEHAKLTIETFDFELNGKFKFDEVEVITQERKKNEDTTGV